LPPSAQEFEAIVEQFGRRVFTHAFRRLGSVEDAEEAAQDAFLTIYQSWSRFEERASLATWIYGITFNVCRHYSRKRKEDLLALDECSEDLMEFDTGSEQRYLEHESRERVGRLLSLLPEDESEALTLYYLEEASYKEISDVLNVPTGSVASLVHRGRERLRKYISVHRLER
jgi:RNA polymerase sigma-70 factor, ECF subfamily